MYKAITDNKTRREEFVSSNSPKELEKLFNELKGSYEKPHVIGKEGSLYSLYYNKKPKTFRKDADLYALKIDNKTGKIVKKTYHRGNTSDLKVDYDVIATGKIVGYAKTVTLYHGEGVSFDEAISMATSYYGTTYASGKVVKKTLYTKG